MVAKPEAIRSRDRDRRNRLGWRKIALSELSRCSM